MLRAPGKRPAMPTTAMSVSKRSFAHPARLFPLSSAAAHCVSSPSPPAARAGAAAATPRADPRHGPSPAARSRRRCRWPGSRDSARIVGKRNISVSVSGRASASRSRRCACTASSEWPPRSKKLSRVPTCGSLSTSFQTTAIACSSSPAGATNVDLRRRRDRAAARRRQRLAVDLAVRRQRHRSSVTKCDGTMNSGRRSRQLLAQCRSAPGRRRRR